MSELWTTVLFVPADRPERFANAAASGAAALVFDLEDAVGPDGKEAARDNLAILRDLSTSATVLIRVNAIGTQWHDADVLAVLALAGVGMMVPKAEKPERLAALSNQLRERPLVALVETPMGLAEARNIARSRGVSGLAFGSVDYCAALGCAHSREALLSARSELVLASSLGGLPGPIDGVTTDFRDDGVCEADAKHASDLGFGGKLCIHPGQLAAVRRGFAPMPDELDWAQQVLDAPSAGASAVEGTMVDEPVRIRARRILARAATSAES